MPTLFVCLLLAFAGCATAPDRPLPEQPGELTAENVSNYVAASERVHVLNTVPVTPTETTLSCDGSVATQTTDGYVAFADCTGGISLPSGEHADEHSHAAYFVSNRTTTRISSRATEGVAATDADAENASGLQLFNFDDEAHVLTVIVREADTSERVVHLQNELNATSGAVVYGVPTDSTTTYSVTVARDDGVTTTFEWRPAVEDELHAYGRLVAVTPSNELVTGRL
ncbi:hypothetical protein AUR64_14185 [Haloprofundus marisrubri]|uniref:Uncharacterized protein n=1 Tax=Haloprofundus marisrubri TaxID=1514971 RepID=A0A0W1R6C8_9EURY|nr:hypothetical protein AUR64_14185 [Haloprofundus marisrubri]